MEKTTAQILGQLMDMARKSGEALYHRARLAAQVLRDPQWIAQSHGGSLDKAEKYLEDECFPDLGHTMTLAELMVLIQEFPQIEQWKSRKYNVRDLWVAYQENKALREPKGAKEPVKRATLKELQEQAEKVEELTYELKKTKENAETSEAEVKRLRNRVRELEQTNSRLEGRIEELERMLEILKERELVEA